MLMKLIGNYTLMTTSCRFLCLWLVLFTVTRLSNSHLRERQETKSGHDCVVMGKKDVGTRVKSLSGMTYAKTHRNLETKYSSHTRWVLWSKKVLSSPKTIPIENVNIGACSGGIRRKIKVMRLLCSRIWAVHRPPWPRLKWLMPTGVYSDIHSSRLMLFKHTYGPN